MSNSREIINRQLLAAFTLASFSEAFTYSIKAIDGFNAVSGKLRIGDQKRTYTPNHRNNGRSKFKRSGR